MSVSGDLLLLLSPLSDVLLTWTAVVDAAIVVIEAAAVVAETAVVEADTLVMDGHVRHIVTYFGDC